MLLIKFDTIKISIKKQKSNKKETLFSSLTYLKNPLLNGFAAPDFSTSKPFVLISVIFKTTTTDTEI